MMMMMFDLSTLALRYDTHPVAAAREPAHAVTSRRFERKLESKRIMISLVLKFLLGNVSVPKLIIERY